MKSYLYDMHGQMLADSVRPVKVCHNDGDGKGDAEHAADSAQGRHQLASRRPGGNITVPCTYVRVIHSCVCLRKRERERKIAHVSLHLAHIRWGYTFMCAVCVCMSVCLGKIEIAKERKIAHNYTNSLHATVRGAISPYSAHI